MNRDEVSILQLADSAHRVGNWSLLIQYLQQLSQDKASTESQSTHLVELGLNVLEAGNFEQRWEIAKVLPRLGEKVIAPLIDIIADADADEELRWYAARILGEFDRPEVTTTLVELLKTSDEELSEIAAAALGQIGSSAIAALTELLADEKTKLLAVRSLALIRRKQVIPPLLSVVKDQQIAVRAIAIEALSSFHEPEIAAILLNALNDLAAPVRREAVAGLGYRPDLREKLDLVNRLIPRLYDFNLDVCTAAAITLGRLGTDVAAGALYQVLKSPHTPVSLQIEIVRALGRIETVTSLEYLRSLLNQELSETIWQEIVAVMGRVEQPELKTKSAEIILEILKLGERATRHQSVKQAIALCLGQLGQIQAIEPLIQLLGDNSAVRLHAIAALKNLDSETVYQQLRQLTNETLAPNLQQGVAIALQEWSN